MEITTPRATVLKEALGQKQASRVPAATPLLTVEEAIGLLRISRWTLYRYIQRNELNSIKFGKRRLFREADLLAFIEQHRVELPA